MPSVTLAPELETFVVDSNPTTNFDSSQYLMIGNVTTVYSTNAPPANAGAGNYYSWVRFNLASIPTTATIISATLTCDAIYPVMADYTSLSVGARRCTDITFTSAVTFNTSPFASLTGAFYLGSIPVDRLTPATINVKVPVTNALSSGKLSLLISGSGTTDDWAPLQSTKYAGAAIPPTLAITYSLDNNIITVFFNE